MCGHDRMTAEVCHTPGAMEAGEPVASVRPFILQPLLQQKAVATSPHPRMAPELREKLRVDWFAWQCVFGAQETQFCYCYTAVTALTPPYLYGRTSCDIY